jgi:DNA polymerase-1
MVRPTFPADPTWRVPDELPELSGIVGLDGEMKDPGITAGMGSSWPYAGQGFVTGWAVSSDQGDLYLPLRHAAGNMDPDRVNRWLKAQAAKPDVTFVYANSIHDMGWLLRDGIEPVNLPIDVQSMAALLDEHRLSLSLDNLALDYLGERKTSKEFKETCARAGLIDPMANMDLVPAWVAAKYAIPDASLTRRLYHRLIEDIRKEDLTRIFELERECALVALDMKRLGVRVDLDKAAREMERFERLRDEALRQVKELTGVNCTATDNVAIARALRTENPRIEFPQTATGKDSIKKEFLDTLNSPVATHINNARRYDKAIGTFFQGYIFGCEVKGRIHADFHPLRRSTEEGATNGTISGRLASSSPNLQNIPARDDEVRDAVRGCFLPEEGERWVTFDYSSQEPRWAVHFAAKAKLKGAWEMVERFRANPRTDLHQETAARMSVKRGDAKTINLAILYGAGGAKICKQLGLPTDWVVTKRGARVEVAGEEGARLIALHERSMPFLRELQKMAETRAKERGYVTTVLGRRGRFEKIDGEYSWTYMALNKAIQGSAADQAKAALNLIRRAGIPISLTVHDSAEFSIPYGAEGDARIARITQLMEQAIELLVPTVVDVKQAENWAGTK